MYRLRYWLPLFAALLTITGCVKTQLVIEVDRDGSGRMGMALGMNEEARAFAGSEGVDPIESLRDEISGDIPDEVYVRAWTEGDYEWVEVKRDFDSLEELREITEGSEMFDSFSLTRHSGLLRDTFRLEAAFTSPLADEEETFTFLDPSAFIQMDLSVTLPGDVQSTTGRQQEETGSIVWKLTGSPTVIRAESETWNARAVALLVVAVLLLVALAATSISAYVMYRRAIVDGEKMKPS
jgi:hypothetical protein